MVTPLRRLYPLPVRQASALPSASAGFAVARDTLAVSYHFPLPGVSRTSTSKYVRPAGRTK